ncbi:hypothetical protein [Priestia koreensis]|uniref:Uncharacterized protein n=1 Tax=Priestia koreensis TaxID=284581 RepID=A0A0M0L7B9_9BACI|nr:hypothetical protein [Priestia koreensis]KOO46950.1 hypothetical protein AMD01_08530 [Priestia koreensis]MCM3002668.1 hypothetical protein [Priestia koreensis]UNL84372.1 hypothetical protein IE339_19865 [Priestia koreensis]
MKRKFNFNSMQAQKWLKTIGAGCAQFIIPLTIFQAVRTLFFPSILDVFLLILFVLLSLAIYLEWI